MLRALVYLRIMSFWNWVRWRARRLRQPKYLAGAVVGAAYFYFFLFRRVGGPPIHARAAHADVPMAVPIEWHAIALSVGAAALLVVLTFMWIVPTRPAALGFSEAEIAFLFPAPITRRALVHFRLLSGQFRSLTGALVMALISNRWSFLGGNALTHAIGWWFVFSTLNLHLNGANFTLTRLANAGLSVVARRVLVSIALAAIMALAVWRLPSFARLPGTDETGGFRLMSDWLVGLTTAAPLSWLLFPVKLILGPFLAPTSVEFCLAFGPALVVVAVHYLWVVRAAVSFEDASIEHAELRSAQATAAQVTGRRFSRVPTRGRKPPFSLGSSGRPEIAFLWKNLLSTWPYFTVRVFGWCALAILGLQLWRRSNPALEPFVITTGFVGGFGAVYLLIFGPQFFRQDIRGDFRHLDFLKTLPLAGWQIVLGEVLTPTAILTGIIWLGLLAAALNSGWLISVSQASAATRFMVSLAAAAIVPPIAMLQLLVPNAAALLFPSWVEATRTRSGGPEVMGQRMIYFFAQLLAIVVLLLPALGIAAGILLLACVVFHLTLAVGIACALGPLWVVLLGEVALGVWWLGERFEAIDVSEELRG